MKKTDLSYGIFLLILGIIIYEFGLLMILHQPISLMTYITNVLPDIQSVELIGILSQLLGGILIVSGFISSVSGIVSIQLENDKQNLVAEVLPRLEERNRNMIASQLQSVNSQASQTPISCRFCGAKLGKEDIFCPTCGKSQK